MEETRKNGENATSWEKKEIHCPLEMAVTVIGGKYKVRILYQLMGRTLRFNELQKIMSTVTPRMLSRQLQELEQDGIIHRKLYPVVPPRTEYSLTERGQSLSRVIIEMYEWGRSMFDVYGLENPCRADGRARMYAAAREYGYFEGDEEPFDS